MITFKKIEKLGVITFNKPPANSYDIYFLNELEKLIHSIELDTQIGAVLIRSEIPKFFSAGADIKVFQSNTVQENKAMVLMANKITKSIADSSKLFVAFLNGHTLGGGLELALACDIRLAANKDFLLGLPEVKLGLMPGNGGIPRLAYAIGFSKALELVVSGNNISVSEAHRLGLVHQVFDESQAEDQVMQYAINLSKGPKKAMAAIKRTFLEGFGKDVNHFLALEKKQVETLYETYDAKEGFLAFVEKRTPKFE